MLSRFVAFFIRLKLGIGNLENFQFVGQKSEKDHYYFDGAKIFKWEYKNGPYELRPAHVSFNWMLDPECKVRKWDP